MTSKILASINPKIQLPTLCGTLLDAEPELAGLVNDVLGDARAGGGDQSPGHGLEHLVVALEGGGLAVYGA